MHMLIHSFTTRSDMIRAPVRLDSRSSGSARRGLRRCSRAGRRGYEAGRREGKWRCRVPREYGDCSCPVLSCPKGKGQGQLGRRGTRSSTGARRRHAATPRDCPWPRGAPSSRTPTSLRPGHPPPRRPLLCFLFRFRLLSDPPRRWMVPAVL
jgi:hypothetical protein